MNKSIKKVVLAYSGGLDTSIILKWLQDKYSCEVVTFTADIGQKEEVEPAREKALKLGIEPKNIFIEDLKEEFVRDYVFPMFRYFNFIKISQGFYSYIALNGDILNVATNGITLQANSAKGILNAVYDLMER
ncbi:MAG TPA: hypothetical protein EYP79_02150, partial [Campylobacterales bacterium]|nr:hypothetical protein [Campylobacterales bacterium]